jgi:hypothetical protein
MRLRLAAVTACVAVLSGAQPAAAQQRGFSPTDLPIVMTAYVDAVIDMRAVYETCLPANKRPAEWEQGSELLIESLKGVGLGAGLATVLEARLSAPPMKIAADCTSEQVRMYSGVPAGANWNDYHRDLLERNGITIVEPRVNDARLTAAQAVVADALPKQKRMLVCISLFEPQGFLAAFSDWNGLVAKSAQTFIDAGFGPKDYRPMLDGALSRALYAPPADRGEAAADCMTNQDWLNRYSTFTWYTFASDIEAALKDKKP